MILVESYDPINWKVLLAYGGQVVLFILWSLPL